MRIFGLSNWVDVRWGGFRGFSGVRRRLRVSYVKF